MASEAPTLLQSEEGVPFARRHDPAFRERLSGSELCTFFNVGHEWGLAVEQQRVLLGGIPPRPTINGEPAPSAPSPMTSSSGFLWCSAFIRRSSSCSQMMRAGCAG
jgi:hypothetical protein